MLSLLFLFGALCHLVACIILLLWTLNAIFTFPRSSFSKFTRTSMISMSIISQIVYWLQYSGIDRFEDQNDRVFYYLTWIGIAPNLFFLNLVLCNFFRIRNSQIFPLSLCITITGICCLLGYFASNTVVRLLVLTLSISAFSYDFCMLYRNSQTLHRKILILLISASICFFASLLFGPSFLNFINPVVEQLLYFVSNIIITLVLPVFCLREFYSSDTFTV